jgi:glycosyltransferase involved in cell wall biosynthesis
MDSLLSRSVSKTLNKLISTKNPKNTTDFFLNFDKEPYEELHKELSIMEDLKKFISSGNNTPICLIFSGTKFIENEGQRPLRLAQEFSKKGYKIIFVGWRWNNKEQINIGDIFPNVFQIPVDIFVKNYREIFDYLNPSTVNKLFIAEFPHPLLLEILSVANCYNWVTIYDVLDDWEEFYKTGNAVWFDKEVEAYVALNSKIVTCVSPTLAEKIENFTQSTNIQVIPNAVSPEMLNTSVSESLPTLIKGKITIGYFGHLTQTWFDWDTLISIANRNPDWTFHIIGYGNPKELQMPNNILLIGKVDPAKLGHYASNWDVAIIPFRESVLSLSVDPIKLYEYLFFKLPIVATGINHIERYPYVWVAHSREEFESLIIKASKTEIDENVIQKFISENSWSKRVDEIDRHISNLVSEGVRI